jgi:hypothetical protein
VSFPDFCTAITPLAFIGALLWLGRNSKAAQGDDE